MLQQRKEAEEEPRPTADEKVEIYETTVNALVASTYPDGKANRVFRWDHFKARKAYKVARPDTKPTGQQSQWDRGNKGQMDLGKYQGPGTKYAFQDSLRGRGGAPKDVF